MTDVNTKYVQYLFAISCAVFLALIMVAPAVAQLKPIEKISDSRQLSQTGLGHSIAQIQEPLLINTDLVTMTVSVTDASGRNVSGLEKKDFAVSDNKVAQEITFFSDDDLSVGRKSVLSR